MKIALDVFGTLLTYSPPRVSPYRHLLAALDQRHGKAPRMPFMSRNVGFETFAEELGLAHLIPIMQCELAEELPTIVRYDDVAETLHRLREQGHQIVLCSNLAQPYGDVVKRLLPGLDGYVYSYEIEAEKPDTVMYQAVCEVFGCKPQDVLFVGDRRRADYEGPIAFGMQARLIDRAAGQTIEEVLR